MKPEKEARDFFATYENVARVAPLAFFIGIPVLVFGTLAYKALLGDPNKSVT